MIGAKRKTHGRQPMGKVVKVGKRFTAFIISKEWRKNKMATAKANDVVEIKKRDIKIIPIKIVGDSPLIVHAWSDKAKKMMLDAQRKTTKTKAKEARDPFDEFINSMYWLTEKPESNPEAFQKAIENGAKFGFPLTGIKQASNAAALRSGWVKDQVSLRGSYFLSSPYGDNVEIISDPPIMREDMVRIGNGSADLRYRGEFRNWHMEFMMEYNANGKYTIEQLINCIDAGGYAVGIGEWRPEKDGMFGRYHIEVEA